MSRPVFDAPAAIGPRVQAGERILLFLDFDGTLAPIVVDPAGAQLPAETRQVLTRLAGRVGVTVSVISGRSLADVESRTGIPGVVYAGNHGMEICGSGVSFLQPRAAASRPAIETLAKELAVKLAHIEGVWVEFKGLTASVHYRRAPAAEAEVARTVSNALAGHEDLLRLTEGRKILEVRPRVDWHKGSAVNWIRRRVATGDALCIYIGDDATDEDAFEALPDGITIRVGDSGNSSAAYRLADPDAVREFLQWLDDCLQHKDKR